MTPTCLPWTNHLKPYRGGTAQFLVRRAYVLASFAAGPRSARKASIIVAISAAGTLSAYKLSKNQASSWVKPEGIGNDGELKSAEVRAGNGSSRQLAAALTNRHP